jgi:PAS domain S-box-containing protein
MAERLNPQQRLEQAEAALHASERRYSALLDSIDEGYCVIEVLFDDAGEPADYRFLEVNAAFESLTGLREARGRRIRELVPDTENYWFDVYGGVALTGAAVRFESAAKHLGRVYDVHAFRIDEPSQRRVAVLFDDITARTQADAALRASRQTLQTIVNHIPAAVSLIRGSDLRLELVNPAYQAIAPGKAMAGKTLNELWPETGQDFEAVCRRVLDTGKPHQVDDELSMIHRRPGEPLERHRESPHGVRLPHSESPR